MNTKSNKMTMKSLKTIKKITGDKLTLGKFLWAIRQSEELSQVEFAEKLGITKQHLCDIEHQRKFISPKLAANYADKLSYAKEQFIRLALQDMVDREGLDILVEVVSKQSKKVNRLKLAHGFI